MNKELKRAMRASVLSAGYWAEKSQPIGEPQMVHFPPNFKAGVKALKRASRPDLISALERRCNRDRYYVVSANDSLYLCRHELR